jgi:hypothetical protein
MILTDPVLEVIRRELRRVSPDVRVEIDQIRSVLATEVLKREVMEGDKAKEASRKIARAANKSLRTATPKNKPSSAGPEIIVPPVAEPTKALPDET